MTEAADGLAAEAIAAPRPIDPFDYFPARQSRIGGLGGHETFSDPSYAFHTHYQSSAPGPLTFKVSVHDLAASYGTLVLRVNVIPVDLRFDPKLVKTAPAPLAMLAESGGEISIEILAKEGMLYALLGHVYEETDASASGITITVQQAANLGLSAGDLQGNEETRHRAAESGGAVHLLSGRPASLAKPVSQSCTPAQLKETVFAHWAKAMGKTAERPDRLWPKVYILQSLKAYGMLEGGARGLGFVNPDDTELLAVMASAGCNVVALRSSAEGGGPNVLKPGEQQICDQDMFEQHIDIRTADAAAIPAELGRFDFLWSRGLCDRLASVADVAAFLEHSLDCLSLGGIAVHVFTLGLTPNVVQSEPTNGLVVSRNVLERVAVGLISHGHEVSQIRYDRAALEPARWGGDRMRPTAIRDGIEIVPFGLVIRKGNA